MAAEQTDQDDPKELIDTAIAQLDDWRGQLLSRVRSVILGVDSGVVEEVKWRKPSNSMLGVPVWSMNGIICTGETYKDKVKLTFAKGASLADPAKLFNSSLDGNTRRAIDYFEDSTPDFDALATLIGEAIAFNSASGKN